MLKTIVKMQFGSRVYGTSVSRSDFDLRAVHIPPSIDILLQRAKNAITENSKLDRSAVNSPDDIDFTSYSLQHYLTLLLKGAPDCLSMLFVPDSHIFKSSSEWERLRQAKESWLYRGLEKMTGFCRGKINEFGIYGGKRIAAAALASDTFGSLIERLGAQKRLEEIRDNINSLVAASGSEFIGIVDAVDAGGTWMLDVCEKKTQATSTLKDAHKTYRKLHDDYVRRVEQARSGEGIDWKELMHVVRFCHEAQELLLDRRITYPRPEAALLLRIRNGEVPFVQVAELIDDGILRIKELQSRTSLPVNPDHEAAERFVAEVYKDHVLSS